MESKPIVKYLHNRRERKKETTKVFQSNVIDTLSSQIEALNKKLEALMQAQT